MGKLEYLCTAGGNLKSCGSCGKQSGNSSIRQTQNEHRTQQFYLYIRVCVCVCVCVCAPHVALVVKNPPANAGDKRQGFDPWIRKIPWRRAWQPTPLFLPGESWTEEPVGL